MCLAIPGKVESLHLAKEQIYSSAKVRFGGVLKEVNISLVPDVEIGEYVLVHVGIAISKVNETEAALTLSYIEKMGELDDLENETNETLK